MRTVSPSRRRSWSWRVARLAATLLPLAAVAGVAGAEEGEGSASPYGTTYTPEELAALDRALHAANCDRIDLTFRKDMAKGLGCLPVVKAMLHDPLLIAPTIDAIAAATERGGVEGVLDTLAMATALLTAGAPPGGSYATARDAVRVRLDVAAPPFLPATPAQALVFLEGVASRQPEAALAAALRADEALSDPAEAALSPLALRHALPEAMAWHPVGPAPFPDRTEAIEGFLAKRLQGYLLERAARIDVAALARAWCEAFLPLLRSVAAWPPEAFPTDAPIVRDTAFGRVALGTTGDETWTGDFTVIVDPGGNDRYERGRFAAAFGLEHRRVGVVIDLAGDDVYDARETDVAFGAAVLGVALLADLGGGNDRYHAGHGSLGAAAGGVAVLYDDGGSDVYEGKTFTQGAAGHGIGLLIDDAVGPAPVVKTDEPRKDPVRIADLHNDRFDAWANAQAFSRPMGLAFLANRRGNDVYHAGGVYLHAPLFSDRYQSFSQGFSIGARDVDRAGGVALLLDRAGNDRYLGDVYNQGVGYWYAAGLLYDGGGHDHYEMTQYGQGSGIHLAVGGLVDVDGHDAYVMHSGLGQGGSHDYAASILHDRGGNDRYHGNTSCNGCGLTNAVGIHLDRAGDDTYAARPDAGFNGGRPARGFGSLGLLVDLGGADTYPDGHRDEEVRRVPDVGVAVDVRPVVAPSAPGGSTPAADVPSGRVDLPAVIGHEGPFTDAVFDELFAIACRWEVGDNRTIVPAARRRLVAEGVAVLPRLEAKMDRDASGLEVRAYADVLKGLQGAGGSAEVEALLSRNLLAQGTRRRLALTLVGELGAKALEGPVAALLADADEALARRAAGVLGQLGSRAGDERLRGWLSVPRGEGGDEARILAALGVLVPAGGEPGRDVEALLDHPLISVRTRLATLLAEHGALYEAVLRRWLVRGFSFEDRRARALRTVLDVFARAKWEPTEADVAAVTALLNHGDEGVRADATRLLRRWRPS